MPLISRWILVLDREVRFETIRDGTAVLSSSVHVWSDAVDPDHRARSGERLHLYVPAALQLEYGDILYPELIRGEWTGRNVLVAAPIKDRHTGCACRGKRTAALIPLRIGNAVLSTIVCGCSLGP